MAVSVVLPIYNAENEIDECLEMILGQTLTSLEVICVDDGSTDGTAARLEWWATRDPRIRVIRQENGGAGAARNAGLAMARGEYLSFLDVDDYYRRGMLERAYDVSVKNNLDILVFRSDEFYPESGRYASIPWTITSRLLPQSDVFRATDVKKDVFKLFVGWTWDKLFKTSFVRENKLLFQELRTTNDMFFTFSSLIAANRIKAIDDVLVHHTKSGGTLSATREKSWDCFHRALCALRGQLKDRSLYERFERDFINYCVHAILWNVETLKEPSRTKLICALQDNWLEELGILQHEKSYFYHQDEYRRLCQLTA